MRIIQCNENYLDRLVVLFEEYRLFCGFEPTPTASREFLAGLMQREASVIFLAIDDETDNLMGFVNVYPSYSTLALRRLWILNDLAVSSDFRGQGVSKVLIKRVLDFAKETNAIRVELKTGKTNSAALRLYQTMQFEIDSEHVYYRVPC